MTLAQLRAFAAVARLGSVTEAARDLGVSVPAVSAAVAGLRRELGDSLYVRADGGIRITAGGRRLAARAADILGLADQAAREVQEAGGGGTILRVAAVAPFAEHWAPGLLNAFTRRLPDASVEVAVAPRSAFTDLLVDRRADVILGPHPERRPGVGMRSEPFLRTDVGVLAAARHRLAGRERVELTDIEGEPWLTGPEGLEPDAPETVLLAQGGRLPVDVRAYSSRAAALAHLTSGHGVMFADAREARALLRRGELMRLAVPGTPIAEVWHATTLPGSQAVPAARALQRFVTTPEALQAMLRDRGGVPAERFRPAVHVTIWS